MVLGGHIINLPLATHNSSSYGNLASRTLVFTKKEGDSLLRITYDDVMGTSMSGTALVNASWRVTINGSPVGRAKHLMETQAKGLHMESRSFHWMISGVSAGTHTLTVQAKVSGAPVLIHGNPNGQVDNLLEVIELLP